jgi:hypothetical protein
MNSSLIGKIDKAKRYAQEPDRINFTQLTVTFRGDNSSHITSCHEGQWHCTCRYFTGHGLCSHTMALERILGEMLPDEARAAGVA